MFKLLNRDIVLHYHSLKMYINDPPVYSILTLGQALTCYISKQCFPHKPLSLRSRIRYTVQQCTPHKLWLAVGKNNEGSTAFSPSKSRYSIIIIIKKKGGDFKENHSWGKLARYNEIGFVTFFCIIPSYPSLSYALSSFNDQANKKREKMSRSRVKTSNGKKVFTAKRMMTCARHSFLFDDELPFFHPVTITQQCRKDYVCENYTWHKKIHKFIYFNHYHGNTVCLQWIN